jgi:acyl-CoA thioester hydrolase
MSFPAPFDRYQGEVPPEWIDANGHMNLAYYVVLFDYATDALFNAIGIGLDYKDRTNHGTFVAETHNLYERELLVGERVRIATQLLASDSKRLHLAHEMFSLASGQRAATQELMYLHIDLGARRVVPWLPQGVSALTLRPQHMPGSPDRTGPGAISRCLTTRD